VQKKRLLNQQLGETEKLAGSKSKADANSIPGFANNLGQCGSAFWEKKEFWLLNPGFRSSL